MYVKYTGPGRGREIRLSNGHEVHAPKGKSVEVPDADGAALLRQKHWAEGSADDGESETDQALQDLTRAELNDLAAAMGVDNAAGMSNKDEVIAAIKAAQAEKGGDQ